MNKIVFVSYYTEGDYEAVAERYLLPSLKKWKLLYEVQKIGDIGNWQLNTSYKSKFILEMLNKHKCPIVFLDADAEILKFPELFYKISDKYDIGAHFLDWYWRWRKEKGNPKREFLSGTLYVPYKQKAIDLIKQFEKEVKEHPNIWEQKAMQRVIERRKDLLIYDIPYSYITFPSQNEALPVHMIEESEIHILHHQVSRKYKNKRK